MVFSEQLDLIQSAFSRLGLLARSLLAGGSITESDNINRIQVSLKA